VKEGKQLWNYEFTTLEKPIIQSARELTLLVTRVINSLNQDGLNEQWANEGNR
jgi:hypothetical protein